MYLFSNVLTIAIELLEIQMVNNPLTNDTNHLFAMHNNRIESSQWHFTYVQNGTHFNPV